MEPAPAAPKPQESHTLILLGLALGLFLAALDQTVVSTSLPRIVAELGGLERFAWLFSAYMLSSTMMVPLAGKLSDRHGRRPVFLAGMGIFLAGSMLCGLAQDMEQLIAFRFVQGLGGGVIFPVVFATVADLYPPSERGRIQGLLAGVWGVSSVVGPLLGGFIVDNTTWRWVFYVNLPVGLAAIAVTWTHFPRPKPPREHPLDWRGAALLSGAIAAFLLLALGGGVDFPWGSPVAAGLAALSIASLVVFVLQERRAPDPVLPLGLFREPVVAYSIAAVMLLGMAMFGAISYLPMFMQGVIGTSATASGAVLTPLTLMVVLGSAVSGRYLSKTGYKPWILAGPLLAAIGLFLMSRLHPGSGFEETVLYTLVLGAGLGFTMATYMVAVQNVVGMRQVGTATSAVTLSRTLGATIGVTVLGALFNNLLLRSLPASLVPPGASAFQVAEGVLRRLDGFDPATVAAVREAFAASLTPLFFAGAIAALLALAASTRIPEVKLKDRAEYFAPQAEAPALQSRP